MFILGHTGLAFECARRVTKGAAQLSVVAAIALLPDVIDKSIHYIIAPEFTNGNTRTIAHSLLFTGALMVALRCSPAFKRLWWVPLIHLCLDGMWDANMRVSLMWPFLGSNFPFYDHEGWLGHLLRIFKKPHVIAGELFGAYVLYRHAQKQFR